jgi:hypothetical protein
MYLLSGLVYVHEVYTGTEWGVLTIYEYALNQVLILSKLHCIGKWPTYVFIVYAYMGIRFNYVYVSQLLSILKPYFTIQAIIIACIHSACGQLAHMMKRLSDTISFDHTGFKAVRILKQNVPPRVCHQTSSVYICWTIYTIYICIYIWLNSSACLGWNWIVDKARELGN